MPPTIYGSADRNQKWCTNINIEIIMYDIFPFLLVVCLLFFVVVVVVFQPNHSAKWELVHVVRCTRVASVSCLKVHAVGLSQPWFSNCSLYCRNDSEKITCVKVLWCHSHLLWLVFEASIPTCTCFHSDNFFLLLFLSFLYCRLGMVREKKGGRGGWGEEAGSTFT